MIIVVRLKPSKYSVKVTIYVNLSLSNTHTNGSAHYHENITDEGIRIGLSVYQSSLYKTILLYQNLHCKPLDRWTFALIVVKSEVGL